MRVEMLRNNIVSVCSALLVAAASCVCFHLACIKFTMYDFIVDCVCAFICICIFF